MVARVLVPWLPAWRNTITSRAAGDPEGPPNPSSTTLAPTDGPASCLTSRLRVMRMGPSRPRPYARPSRSQIDVYWRLM